MPRHSLKQIFFNEEILTADGVASATQMENSHVANKRGKGRHLGTGYPRDRMFMPSIEIEGLLTQFDERKLSLHNRSLSFIYFLRTTVAFHWTTKFRLVSGCLTS